MIVSLLSSPLLMMLGNKEQSLGRVQMVDFGLVELKTVDFLPEIVKSVQTIFEDLTACQYKDFLYS